ncbi:hypothetical protein, partial [Fischerella thermalis]|uniref:hypothetical protein n=1 Tax=Fischerella thermalis TaxID=372787 RepID=UPI001CA4D8CD
LNTLCTPIIRLFSARVISDRLFILDFPHYIFCLICQCVTSRDFLEAIEFHSNFIVKCDDEKCN